MSKIRKSKITLKTIYNSLSLNYNFLLNFLQKKPEIKKYNDALLLLTIRKLSIFILFSFLMINCHLSISTDFYK